ncbi:MAG: ATP-binding protein [Bacillota bacterium]|jgi:two-component system sensor histidine kinase VicK|nr:ATP-binding protein [Bacillota bacterium]NLM08896.1 cell wall metabolism sensor histidine kinase WalK [Clostridiales Family XIII bacterium]
MFAKRRWRSIRFRIVLIYFLLVFIAMTVIGVFITDQLEAYQMELIRSNFTKIVQESVISLQEYEHLNQHREEIQADIQSWAESLREEMFVVDDGFVIIASSNSNYIDRSALDLLDQSILVRGMTGEISEQDRVLASGIPVKNMVFPIEKNGNVKGLVCLRADITSVYQSQSQARMIIIQAMLAALLITVGLGFFIARSITVPINDVTEKALKMSEGDFSQEVSVRSDDEIGRLAEMFNLLREKLDYTLAEINSEKNKLETILKNMGDGLLAVDNEGRIILANHAAMQMLDLKQKDIEDKSYDEIVGKFSKNLLYENIRERSLEGGYHEVVEKAGRAYDVRYDRYTDESGQDMGMIVVFQDITEQQKLENMQRDFVANVSHELKTPLTTIKSYTETLMHTEINDCSTIEHFLRIIDEETDRMSRLVRNLLQLSKLDYKQEKWFKKDTNLVNVVKTALSKVEMTAANKDQQLISLFDPKQRIMTVIDRDRIDQVLLNVLTNAIKYTPEGGKIEVDVFSEDPMAKVVIADSGIGIAEKEIPRVFERFYRVDKARSREMGGTGLGLSIAKQIVEEHGGTIAIQSKLGEGTRVTISLPLSPTRGQRNIE